MCAKTPGPVAPRTRWRTIFFTAVAVATSLIVLLAVVLPSPHDEELDQQEDEFRLAKAQALLESSEFRTAEQVASSVVEASDLFGRSRLIAGEAATRDSRMDDALKHYSQIASGTSEDAIMAAYAMGEIFRSTCQLERAQRSYTHVLQNDPSDAASHERMAFILGVTHHHWEAAPHYLALVKAGAWTLDSLAILSDIERSIEQPEFVADCAIKEPHDVLSQMAVAAQELYDGNRDAAKSSLQEIVQKRPDLSVAQAMLGELLLTEDEKTMARWSSAIPVSAADHPGIWFVRGLQSRKEQQLELAAGCFAISVTLFPEHRRATYQLGQVLTQLKSLQAEPFVERAKQQAELGLMLDQVLASRGRDKQSLKRVTELSETLGRLWEAWAWATTATKLDPGSDWSEPFMRRCAAKLQPSLPRTTAEANLASHSDLGIYISKARSRSWASDSSPSNSSAPLSPSLAVRSQLRFERERDVGIGFVYHNGADASTPGARMFEQTGGGVGVIDYDNDGWPDLYFTQGGEWKTGENQPTPSADYRDCLYRNLAGQRFEETALAARVENLSFGQGIAVGDYDADGFADLFVANIGRNRMWHNNGDGTFAEVTDGLNDGQHQWTTSAALVDLNGDGLSDIFEVNYLQGEEVFSLICGNKGCSPKVFEGAPDQIRINRGDGTFELLPDACPTHESKGLGVVAFRLPDEPLPALLVANDQVPNHLLILKPGADGSISVKDEALLRGLAVNSDGLPMASMGIAADDVDQNGLLDFLITNFRNEADTLFVQDSPGLFTDATPVAGMRSVNFPYVGWGTQFIDADLDGDSDVVVVNGDIDDYRAEGGHFEMPPQLYENVGKGRFLLVNAKEAGEYFTNQHLARALAKLDWNRDGLVDFVVSNIGSSAALVTNRSSIKGGSVSLRLHGTKSERHPIGAIITVKTDKAAHTKQLLAGDGYQASNERIVQFGLGQASAIETIDIQWPSGEKSRLSDVPLNSTIEVIEGSENGEYWFAHIPTSIDAVQPE